MDRIKILLFGKNGQLGWEAQRELFCLGNVVAFDFPEVDFTNPTSLLSILNELKPDLIYNAVAYTAVDKAETESELAEKINATTPSYIAEWCKKHDKFLIHFSTDYVFDGITGKDYSERDDPNPLNIYGKTKLSGENAIKHSGCKSIIFRTSWVYSSRAGGFLRKFITWAQTNDILRIVDDQIGNPTWARTLAILSTHKLPTEKKALFKFFEEKQGLYHLAGGGSASRLEWSEAILENIPDNILIKTKTLLPAKTNDFPALAHRPLHSALNCDKFEKTFETKIPHWAATIPIVMQEFNG